MAKLRVSTTSFADGDPAPPWIAPVWIAPEDRGPDEIKPQYFVYSGSELLGYSFLEKGVPSVLERTGRFHPEENYFEYAETFSDFTRVMNESFDANVKAAYLGADAENMEAASKFAELSTQVSALNLHIADANGQPVTTTELRIDDYVAKYDDATERWLYIVVADQKTYDEFFG